MATPGDFAVSVKASQEAERDVVVMMCLEKLDKLSDTEFSQKVV